MAHRRRVLALRTGRGRPVVAAVAATLAAAALLGACRLAPEPERRVNTTTAGDQGTPVVATAPDGRSVVAWASEGQDGDGWGVVAQRVTAGGRPTGPEIEVNTHTPSHQRGPAVAMAPSGAFVVAWHSDGQDGSRNGIFARRFDARGVAVGPDFQVNTETQRSQVRPAVAMGIDGRFVVVWMTDTGRTADADVRARRFDRAGVPLGDEVRVHDATPGDEADPAVAMRADGAFVVVWSGNDDRTTPADIIGQRFTAAGERTGPRFRVNTTTEHGQWDPRVAVAPTGGFLVTWTDEGATGVDETARAQAFGPDGRARGGELLLGVEAPGAERTPTVAATGLVGFVVAWVGHQDGARAEVRVQPIRSDGRPEGAPLLADAGDGYPWDMPQVAADLVGRATVTWSVVAADGTTDVAARRFRPAW